MTDPELEDESGTAGAFGAFDATIKVEETGDGLV